MLASAPYICSPRIVSRTWKKDPYINNVVMTTVIGKKSITKLIQHSEVYRARFQRNCSAQSYCVTSTKFIKQMSSSNHRFDSHELPFGRAVVFYRPLCRTAQNIQDDRKGREEGTHASNWLASVDEEFFVTMGMTADGGRENLGLTRFFDNESYDKSKQCHEVLDFLNKIKYLFIDGGCLKVGFTALMIKMLERPMTIWVGTGPTATAKTIGGPGTVTPELVQRALCRFKNWVALATLVVKAEFPNFDALASMCIFELDGKTTATTLSKPGFDEHLERVAKLCRVDGTTLRVQLEDYLPRALRFAKGGSETGDAWRLAVEAVRRTRATASHPLDVLLACLVRLGGYGGSTSGVERYSWETTRKSIYIKAIIHTDTQPDRSSVKACRCMCHEHTRITRVSKHALWTAYVCTSTCHYVHSFTCAYVNNNRSTY